MSSRVRRLGILIATVAFSAAGLSVSSPAQAEDDFAISLPAAPILAQPGQTVDASLRVVNRSQATRNFSIRVVKLESLDNGRTAVAEGQDEWTNAVAVVPTAEVGPAGYVDVPVKVGVPLSAPIDIHLIGIAVEPIKGGAPNEIDMQNQVVNHIAIEVPGDAHRSVAIKNHLLPKLVVGNKLDESFDVFNDGTSAVKYRGQVYIDSRFGGANLAVVRTGDVASPELLPAGRTKTAHYEWAADGAFALVRPTVELNYANGTLGMTSVKSDGRSVLLVTPVTLVFVTILLVTLVAGCVLLLIRRRQRRGPSGRERPDITTRARLAAIS